MAIPQEAPNAAEELDWVRRAKRGDREAFGQLVALHQGRAYRVALRVLRSEEAARDAVQDAFLKAWTSLPRFRGEARFSTWLHRMVVNRSIDLLRKEHPERRVDAPDADALERVAADAKPDEPRSTPFAPAAEVMRKELREQLADAIAELPEALRQTFLLREVDGLSYAEIARTQGIPRGTVMSRLHYARRRTRELLEAAGVAPSGGDAGEGEEQ